MKRIIVLFTLAGWGMLVSAQNSKVQSAINYLDPQNNQLDKAKEAVDSAVINEKTFNSPIAWKVRGDVYYAISVTSNEKYKALSDNPLMIAFESYEKAVLYNPEYMDAYYALGALSYNKASEMIKAANDIPAINEAEYNAAVKAASEQLNLSVPYFEKAHAINPFDKNTILALQAVYFKLRNDHPEYEVKFKEMDEKLNSLSE